MRKIIIVLACGWLAGCAVTLEDSGVLRLGIDYLDKSISSTSQRAISPEPGMRLKVTSNVLRGKKKNLILPLPATFEWIIPESDNYSREDFLAVTSLLAAADTGGSGDRDPIICFEAIGERIRNKTQGLAFFQEYGDAVLGPIISSLELEYHIVLSGESAPKPGSPAWYKALATEGMPIDFGTSHKNSTAILSFETNLPDGSGNCVRETIKVFDYDNDPYFTWEPRPYKSEKYPNVWVGQDSTGAQPEAPRVTVMIEIPVSIAGEPGVRFVPFHSSVADLETLWGVEIAGISRSGDRFPDEELLTHLPPDEQIPEEQKAALDKARPDRGKRFEIWFDGVDIIRSNVRYPLLLTKGNEGDKKDPKPLTLVTAGDVIMTR